MAVEGDVNPVFNYKTGLRFMWPFPDDLLRTLNKPLDIKYFFSDLLNPYVKKNVILDDIKPTLSLIWNGISLMLTKGFPKFALSRFTYTL